MAAREHIISFIFFQIEVCTAEWLDRGPEVAAPEYLYKYLHVIIYYLLILYLIRKTCKDLIKLVHFLSPFNAQRLIRYR